MCVYVCANVGVSACECIYMHMGVEARDQP